MTKSLRFNEETIKNHLFSFEDSKRPCFTDKRFIKSAVIVPLVAHEDNSYEILFIKRTENESDKHSGEMAFPGGKFDPNVDQNLRKTALRETEEEIGVPSSKINLLGCLKDHITPKKYIITPFIGFIHNYTKLIKDNQEVAEIVKIPISYLANEKYYSERTYTLKNSLIAVGKYTYQPSKRKKYVIFGASCHIIVDFIETVYSKTLKNPTARRLACADFSD